MPVTNYHTMNGEIIGETTSGVRTDYLTDALGSVTATMNQSAQIINTYRYKPFGALLAKTGTGADPAFGWVGSQGYRQTNKKFSNFHVRHRHYDMETARWTTKDPIQRYLKEISSEYIYAVNNPIIWFDYYGLTPNNGNLPTPSCRKCQEICKNGGSPALAEACLNCWNNCKMNCSEWSNPHDPPLCPPGQTPVFITTYNDPGERGRCAVYCSPEDCRILNRKCKTPHGIGFRNALCDSSVNLHLTIPGFGDCVVNNSGCGQHPGHIPNPNNWIDFWSTRDIKCWVCMKLPSKCTPPNSFPNPQCI